MKGLLLQLKKELTYGYGLNPLGTYFVYTTVRRILRVTTRTKNGTIDGLDDVDASHGHLVFGSTSFAI